MMERKNQLLLLVLVLLIVSPMAGLMIGSNSSGDTIEGQVGIPEPFRSYSMSADCAVDTTSTSVTNLDDTDNLYGGQYKSYNLIVNTSYAGGGDAITNITTAFYKSTTTYASFVFTQSTGLFAESEGSTYVKLGTGTNVTSGNYCNLTIPFHVEWAFPDTDDVDINVTVWNAANSTSSQKNANYDFDTDLVLASTDFIATLDARASSTINPASIIISYEDSGGDNYPLGAQTDFYITRTPATGSTDSWTESSYTDSTGVLVFAAITAGHIAQAELYTFTAYTQGGTTTNLMGSTYTDTVYVSNSGSADDPDGSGSAVTAFGDVDVKSVLAIGLIGSIGYVLYNNYFKDGKSKKRRKRKS